MSYFQHDNPHEPSPEKFDVSGYLDTRNQASDFLMVEIGHGSLPVAYQQPTDFRDGRAYVGVEGWTSDPTGHKRTHLDFLHQRRAAGQNIFYITQRLGGEAAGNAGGEKESSWYVGSYEGSYEATTLLPDAAADEVFIGNVFSDPLIAKSDERAAKLLLEAARITVNAGILIMRETITPWMAPTFSPELLRKARLISREIIDPTDKNEWDELEKVYKTEPATHPYSISSYYRFFTKHS